MKLLPILLFAICYLLFATPISAAESIDTSAETPSYGTDIKFKEEVEATAPGKIKKPLTIPQKINVKPQKINFPDFSQLRKIAAEALPNLLPEGLRQNLALPPSIPLKGVVFHPTCPTTKESKEKPATASGETTFNTPAYWPELLGATKLQQAIAVPGESSGVNFAQPAAQTLPQKTVGQLPDCPQPEGMGGETVEQAATGSTNIFVNWLQKIIDFLKGKFQGTVAVVIKPQKFMQGEKAFSEQVQFLRSFCPEERCPKEPNSLEEIPYEVTGQENPTVKMEFLGASEAREGLKNLKDSLCPEELKPCKL